MILAIDIGNTNIVLGCVDDNKTYFIERLSTIKTKMELEYAIDIKMVLDIHGIKPEKLEGAIISSVVPQITYVVKEAAEKILKKEILVIGSGIKTGLDIRIDDPGQLGADLVVDPTKEDLPAIVDRETNGQGMDVIVMAIGVPALVNSTLKLCKRGGTVNLFAGFAGTGESTVEVNTIHYNEINVNGSTAYKLEDYLAAAEMIKSGKIDADKIVTHRFKIEDFQKAYDVCAAGAGLKVIIEP